MGLKVDIVGVEFLRLTTDLVVPILLESSFLAFGLHGLDGFLAPDSLILEVFVPDCSAGDLSVFLAFDSHLLSDSWI